MKKILIIDDQIDIQEVLADYLRNLNYKVDAYANTAQAMKALEATSYDLVLTDLSMPGGDGFELIEQVKHKFMIPVVVMTGGVKTPEHLEALKGLEKNEYKILKKPFSRADLLAAVKLFLD